MPLITRSGIHNTIENSKRSIKVKLNFFRARSVGITLVSNCYYLALKKGSCIQQLAIQSFTDMMLCSFITFSFLYVLKFACISWILFKVKKFVNVNTGTFFHLLYPVNECLDSWYLVFDSNLDNPVKLIDHIWLRFWLRFQIVFIKVRFELF